MNMNLEGVVHMDPEILGGKPVFVGTRVPLRNFVDYLEADYSVDDFLRDFPSVSRDQVVAVLEEIQASAARARIA